MLNSYSQEKTILTRALLFCYLAYELVAGWAINREYLVSYSNSLVTLKPYMDPSVS